MIKNSYTLKELRFGMRVNLIIGLILGIGLGYLIWK